MRGRSLTAALLAASVLAVVIALPAGSGAATPPGLPHIDLRVLVIHDTGVDDDAYNDWVNTLNREGVPYDTYDASKAGALPTLSSTLGDGTLEAKYQGIVISGGAGGFVSGSPTASDGLSQAQWTAITQYEAQFAVRQVTAYNSGLNSPTINGLTGGTGETLDGKTASLTPSGQTVFPYLKGTVAFTACPGGTGCSYGVASTADAPAGDTFDTLLSDSAGVLLGVFTTSDGRQNMVQTFNQNQYEIQSALVRHGELAWLTRGVYLGDQRNYIETHIDDNFLPDDSWDPTTHTTNYDPAVALRETPADVAYAAQWSAAHGFRIDMLFNGGGSTAYAANNNGSDPLLAAFKNDKNDFGWISHTWDHPNLDCGTANYIEAELNQNISWAESSAGLGLTVGQGLGQVDPAAVVTGEHAGLANLVPGNPGTVDPPDIDQVTPGSGGSVPAGNYWYAVTDDFTVGGPQSSASIAGPFTVSAGGSAQVQWQAVCHAAEYKIYRGTSESGPWQLVGTRAAQSTDFANPTSTTVVGNGGAQEITFNDTAASGSSATLPSVDGAKESPYAQNKNLVSAFNAAGIRYFGSDASKPYPNPADGAVPSRSTYPAGASFPDGNATAVPRHPTNIYYNVGSQAQELDEYNWLYTSPPTGNCQPIPNVTTCNSAPLTFDQIIQSISGQMFQYMMANDPRPDYFHQTNLMTTVNGQPAIPGNSPDKGLYYVVMDALLGDYQQYFNTSNTPFVQLTMAQIAQLLSDQSAWSAATSGGKVSGYISGATVTLTNSSGAPIDTPMTGVLNVGAPYAGARSGWTSAPTGTSTYTAMNAWPTLPGLPVITTQPTDQSTTAGGTVTFSAAADSNPTATEQWQTSTDGGTTWSNVTGATTTLLSVANVTAVQNGTRYRIVFTNSYGSTTSNPATLTVIAPATCSGPPTITQQPTATTAQAGQPASFTASATSPSGCASPPSVQWEVSGDGGQTFSDVPGANSTTLSLANVAQTQNGQQYRAVFADQAGNATTGAAALTVTAPPPPPPTCTTPPSITQNPAAVSVTAGQAASFTAAATNPSGCTTGPTVQWQVSTDGGTTYANVSGGTTTTLSVPSTTQTQSGSLYRALFANENGAATTPAAQLTVGAPANMPAVTMVSPRRGSPFSLMLIFGRNFANTTGVYVGGRATVYLQLTPQIIIAVAPLGPFGTVDVTVKTAVGTSPATAPADSFIYPFSLWATSGRVVQERPLVTHVRRGTASVALRCVAPLDTRCKGTLMARLGGRLEKSSFAIPARQRTRVNLQLSRSVRRSVVGHRHVLHSRLTILTMQPTGPVSAVEHGRLTIAP